MDFKGGTGTRRKITTFMGGVEMKFMKYPRTYHLPWSEGRTSDDKVLSIEQLHNFEGREVVITEKRDGENSTLRYDKVHARSLDSKDHESRHWLKSLWDSIRYSIPENFRICGENLFAKHSIYYDNLDTYFEVFSIWENDKCLSWDDTIEYCELLNLKPVPVIYRGVYGSEKMWDRISKYLLNDNVEGYVIRLCDSFSYYNFDISVAKWVRKNHVQTDKHWMNQPIVKNMIREVQGE